MRTQPPASTTPSHALRIVGGRVVDPRHGPPRVRDVLIAGDRVVEQLPPPPESPPEAPPEAGTCRTIDATGKLVLAGALDMHSHIASPGVTLARSLSEQSAELIPDPGRTALEYLKMGYTTVIDAAVAPEEAESTHAVLDRMPGLSTGFLLELGVHRTLLETLDVQGEAAAAALLAELVSESGAFGLKLVNPGHMDELDTPISFAQWRTRSVTPRWLIRFVAEAVAAIGLSHPVHLHAPFLGQPGNIRDTLAMLEALADRRLHLAHAQFYAYGSTPKGQYTSEAATLAGALGRYPGLTLDAGCISFGPAMMITRDAILADRLHAAIRQPRVHRHGWSVMPLHYLAGHPIHGLQWATGLELILQSPDLARTALTVDHPNGGPFTAMPQLMRYLADRKLRECQIAHLHPAVPKRSGLAQLDRELSTEELVTLTRVAPAKALGLSDRGHLGPGARADVVIAERVDGPATLVIQGGRVVLDEGELQVDEPGQRLRGLPAGATDPSVAEGLR